ncbi:zinc finger protein 414 isoform X2 [Paroedura picta]|uniref:zinc finger protein 414 isoform X2 n=1 Tax=Paroedura picta TaxID=143630 RepID=UPI00405747F1
MPLRSRGEGPETDGRGAARDKMPSPVPGLPAHSAATTLPCPDLTVSPSLPQNKGEEEEASSSLPGCSDPGLLENQINPVFSSSSSSSSGIQTQDQRLPKRRPIQGKTFCCSALGCADTFPCMQDLMEHTKTHYKPNRYFKCENCMSRFQTHRSLFKHLHVCSDNRSPSSTSLEEKPAIPTTSGPEKEPPGKWLNRLSKFQSVIQHAKKEAVLPAGTEAPLALERDSLMAGLSPSSLGPVPPPSSASHPFSVLEPTLFGPPPLARSSGPPHTPVSGPFLPYMHPPLFPLPQNRFRPYLPGQGLPVSNAVWKKSQGHSSNSRIVWEHTRGRYKCLQCAYSAASRKEMTRHVEDHRKNAPPPGRLDEDMDFGVSLSSLHSKMPPEMDTSLYSPL